MEFNLIDTHAHVNFNQFKDDGDKIIRRALDKKIATINVGSQFDTSRRAIEIAGQYDEGVYAAIGLHPIHLFDLEVDEDEAHFTARQEKFDGERYQKLIDEDRNKKIVAVGEIGFDYYHLPQKTKLTQVKKIQRIELVKQIEFAIKNNLPVILHSRGTKENPFRAYDDLLEVIMKYKGKIRGVKHCFTAKAQTARNFIDLGFYIGFTGIITFGKNADSVREVVKNIPIEKILVETDCPYLAPDPHRGERNEPSYVEYVAKKIAEIKNMDFVETAQILAGNSRKLFQI